MTITSANNPSIIPVARANYGESHGALINESQTQDGVTIHTKGMAYDAKSGSQNHASAELLTLGFSNESKTVSGKLQGINATVSGGTENPDGSHGVNINATLTAIAAEATFSSKSGDNSLTLGAGVGAGIAISSGIRDIDGDGQLEHCTRISVGFATVGACIERPKTTGFNLRARR